MIDKKKYYPFILSFFLVIFDQITKAIVVAKIPLNNKKISLIGDFLTFIHVRNLGMGFSIGNRLIGVGRVVVMMIIPGAIACFIFYCIAYGEKKYSLSRLQIWSLSVIGAGSVGTLIDRIFRPLGVVDFINIKIYGLFGMEYWPTFNVSDSLVVIGTIVFLIAELTKKDNKNEKY